MGKLQYILNERHVNINDTVFEDNVVFKTEIPVDKKDEIINEITEATSARAVITLGDEIFG